MDFSELNQITSAFFRSRIIQVAVKLEVFDAIRNEGNSSEELAKILNTEPSA